MSTEETFRLFSERVEGNPEASNEIPDITRCSKTYFLLTSFTSGSSSVVTATNRLEFLLQSNKVPFVIIDLATHDKAKAIWRRRGNGKRLPAIVHDGDVLGSFEDLEAWNEYGALKRELGIPEPVSESRKPSIASLASISSKGSQKPAGHPLPPNEPGPPAEVQSLALVQAAAQAAAVAAEKHKSGAFSVASSRSSIISVRSTASAVKLEIPGSGLKFETTMTTAPTDAKPMEEEKPALVEAPVEAEVANVISEKAPEEVPQVQITVEKPADKPAKATKASGRAGPASSGGLRSRVPAGVATKQTKTGKATPRSSLDKKNTSRPGSRASVQSTKISPRPSTDNARPVNRATSLRSESKLSIRPDSKAGKRTTTKDLKAPSISAKSVNSISSSATGKAKDRSIGGKDGKSRIDKLKKEEGQKCCGMCTIS